MLSQYLLPKFLFDIVRASTKHALGPLPRSEFSPRRVVSCRAAPNPSRFSASEKSTRLLRIERDHSTMYVYSYIISFVILPLRGFVSVVPLIGTGPPFNVLFNIIKIIYFGFTDFQRLSDVKIVNIETSDIMT